MERCQASGLSQVVASTLPRDKEGQQKVHLQIKSTVLGPSIDLINLCMEWLGVEQVPSWPKGSAALES